MLKSFLLFLLIGFITFWITCGWTILIFTWLAPVWWVLIIIGFIALYLLCKNFLWKYTWRYFNVSFIMGFIYSIIVTIVMQMIIWPILSRFMSATFSIYDFYIFTLIQFLLQLFILYICVIVFHFYRIKNQTDAIRTWSIWEDISSLVRNNFKPITHLFGGSSKNSLNTSWLNESNINESNIIEEKSAQVQENPITPSESTQFMISLKQVDISNIDGIIFLPKIWQWFKVNTPNIKRLVVYITTKLGKTSFEAEELRNIYNHVVENLQSNLSATDYKIVQWKINEFVQCGGDVKIERI